MRRFATVRTKTTLGASIVVGLALVALGVLLSVVTRSTMTEQIDETLGARALEVASFVDANDDPTNVDLRDGEDSFTQIVSAHGEVLSSSSSLADMSPLTNAPAGSFVDLPGQVSGTEHVRAHVGAGPQGTKVIVATTLEGVDDVVAVVTTSLWLGLPLLLLLVAGSTWIVTGRTLAPVEAIRAEVAGIGPNDLHKRVPTPRARDEVALLADTMNVMLERLERANERQRRFVSDASHELRTPIATIRHELEVALSERSPDWASMAERILQEDLRMQRLVDDLLWLASHDESTGIDSTPREHNLVDLDDIAFSEAQRQRSEGPPRIAIDTSKIGAGQVRGSPDDLRRAVRNIVDNARRHADQRIAVAVTSVGASVVLHFDDDGPGVNRSDRHRIFERFTRIDEARGRDDGGVGLGLAITSEIVTGHGGAIAATQSPLLGGARFTISLPSTRSPN